MVDQELLDRGFMQYKPSEIDHESVEACFQKRYDDEKGKKYFINVKKWASYVHPYSGEIFPESYEYDTQLYKKDDHDAINLLFHSTWSLDDVEDYIEKFWNTGLFDYYEKFEY